MKKTIDIYFAIISVAAVYYLAARFGLTLAYPGTNATPIWLPTGIALSAVLIMGNRIWPGISMGAFAANFHQSAELGLSVPASAAASIGASFGNTIEALVGAYLIHRFTGTRNPFERSSHVLVFIICGAMIASAISATIGPAAFCLAVSDWNNFASMWVTWWLGDATGAIVLAPLVLTFRRFGSAGWKSGALAGDLLLWAFIGSVCYMIWSWGITLNFILFPLLIIAAFRLGQFGSAVAVGVISVVSTYVTVKSSGPFTAESLAASLLLQQGFIASIATTSMVLSAIVSERKKSDLKLHDSEKRYRMLIEQAPIGIVLSRDGVTLDANTVYLGMFGFADIGELRGTHIIDRIAPHKRAEISGHMLRHDLGQTIASSYETVGLRKDGSQFPYYVSLNRISLDEGPFTVSFLIDITERKRAEDALLRSEFKYRELVMNANSIILRMNSDGIITFINEYGLKFFGYTGEELLGRHVIGAIVEETESSGRDLAPLLAEICADPARFEHNINENIRRNGERVWINWTNRVVLDELGKPKEVLSIGADITALKQAEEELKKHREHLEQLVSERTDDLRKSQLALTNIVEDLNLKKEELAAANERLKELDRLKSMFIASMSHELRTPLNSIIGFTGMTLQGLSGPLNDEQKDNLSRSYQSARHLLSLITDIIDISKIESGRIDTHPESFALSDVIADAVNSIKPQLKDKDLSLSVDAPVDLRMNTDRKRLLQCLLNFLSNAVKFTESGSITLTSREVDGNVEITVTDSGIGIAENDMPRLFEAFERLDSHLRVKAGGTGLGLYLTKKLATDILRGDVSVRSREGQGSSFTLKVARDISKRKNFKI